MLHKQWTESELSATKAILLALFSNSEAVQKAGLSTAITALGKMFEGKRIGIYEKERLNRAIYQLKSRKLVDVQSHYQKEVFSLTKLGKKRGRELAKYFGIIVPEKWDGKWRIVTFDIPEQKKSKREVFRILLKSLGFVNVQKSLWIHPYDCEEQIYFIAGNMLIQPYVRYIVAESITGQDDLRRRFDL